MKTSPDIALSANSQAAPLSPRLSMGPSVAGNWEPSQHSRVADGLKTGQGRSAVTHGNRTVTYGNSR